jgi:hypothetical protein
MHSSIDFCRRSTALWICLLNDGNSVFQVGRTFNSPFTGADLERSACLLPVCGR